MTFRAGKRHRVQESGKSTKNVLRLASRLQRFLNTGKASKQDLKAIDAQFISLVSDYGDKILQLLDQLRERMPKTKGRDAVNQTCQRWMKWLDELNSKSRECYSNVQVSRVAAQNALLESVVDAESDFFRMLGAFNSTLDSFVRKSSYELPNAGEISNSVDEILELYNLRQRLLAKVASRN